MSKYNTVIHILFWCLVAVLIFTAAVITLTQNSQLRSLFVKTETEVVVQKEPVYVTKVEHVMQETEWFYFVATGYSANDPEQGTNNITATGKEIKKGMIAVDPKVIPSVPINRRANSLLADKALLQQPIKKPSLVLYAAQGPIKV